MSTTDDAVAITGFPEATVGEGGEVHQVAGDGVATLTTEQASRCPMIRTRCVWVIGGRRRWRTFISGRSSSTLTMNGSPNGWSTPWLPCSRVRREIPLVGRCHQSRSVPAAGEQVEASSAFRRWPGTRARPIWPVTYATLP
jgi:hypothetical protein